MKFMQDVWRVVFAQLQNLLLNWNLEKTLDRRKLQLENKTYEISNMLQQRVMKTIRDIKTFMNNF